MLEPDELEPAVIDSVHPTRVIWSSLWIDRPDDRLVFEIEPDRQGSRVKWSLDVGEPEPAPDALQRIRHRVDFLINGALRLSFGQ